MGQRSVWGAPMAGNLRKDGWLSVLFPDLPLTVYVKVEDVKGTPELVGLRVEPLKIELVPLSSELVRQIPLRQLKDAYLLKRRGGDLFAPFETPPRRGPTPLSPEHYDRVAKLYRQAVSAGKPPLLAIQDVYNVSRPAASKYVRRARELDKLGYPERAGVAGASSAISPYTPKKATPKRKGKR